MRVILSPLSTERGRAAEVDVHLGGDAGDELWDRDVHAMTS